MIIPTVGRVVWYYPRKGEIEAGTIPDPEGQPLAAIIAHVNPDSVNLMVISARGTPYCRNFIPLMQEGDAQPAGDYCEWPKRATPNEKPRPLPARGERAGQV